MSTPRKRRRTSDGANDHDVSSTAAAAASPDADGLPPQKKQKQQQRRSLFVRSLAPTTTTNNLIAHFSQSFPIKHATAVVDPATRACRGYGFITFADADDAVRAMQEYNGSELLGKKIKLEVAEPRKRDVDGGDGLPADGAGSPSGAVSTSSSAAVEAKKKREQERKEAHQPPKLIVRNLPWSIKKSEDLALLFRSYGKVKHSVIPSKKPGLLSGFGFVVLRGRKNAEKALEGVNGKEVDGRTLAVDWAVDKDVWEEQNKIETTETEGNEAQNGTDEDMSDPEEGTGDDAAESSDPEENDDNMDDFEGVDQADGDIEPEKQAEDFSSTLFIRNLPFQSTDDSLNEHFSQFGRIRYARVVLDRDTERPKGTGFVCFFKPEDAKQCLRHAPSQAKPSNPSKNTLSILQSELDDPSGNYTMEGRVLQVTRAVDRNEAARLTEEGVHHRGERDKDKRRLYLLSEGTISSKSPLYQKLSSTEIATRDASLKQRKTLIQSNPSLHLSLTRLSVRNIPRTVNSRDLKALAREAVVGFAKDVKEGKRTRLSKEELARGGDAMAEAEKFRKQRGVGVVKQAKVVFEGREGGKVAEESGAGRSRGYGFVEYYSHRSALMGLRWLNGHALEYKVKDSEKGNVSREELQDRKKRLIVEFAIENAQVVKRRSEREHKSREKPQPDDRTQAGGNEDAKDSLFNIVPTSSKDRREAKAGGAGLKKQGAKNDATAAKGKPNEDDEKQAKRQRIINKKRAMRRGRRKVGGKA